MTNKKSIAALAAGSGAGIAQTFILREYVDKVYGPIPGLESLGGFGTYSALGGIVAGGAATAAGLVSVLTGKLTRSEMVQLGLIGYGIPALSGGILNGLFPAITIPGARLRAPARGAPVAGRVTLRAAGIPSQKQVAPAGQVGSAIPLRT